MLKVIEKLKTIDYRHYICGGITVLFVILNIFVFRYSFPRIWESVVDLGTSIAFYFSELCGLNINVSPTVINFTSQPFKLPFNLPETWELFVVEWEKFWALFITAENFSGYNSSLGNVIYWVTQALVIVLPIVCIFLVVGTLKTDVVNNDYNTDTKPLTRYKKVLKTVYEPTRDWVKGFITFIKENGVYKKLWLLIWAINFNVISIVIEFIAFYFYFITSFDFINIYRQVVKLFIDLSVVINFVPLIVWIIVGFIIFDKVCRKIGYARLQYHESKNCGFINERPIVMLICGTMGKKKTTLITDMALSEDIILRDKAFEKILENDLKFPYFPWINLELEIKKAIEKHNVYSLATCRQYVRFFKRYFDLAQSCNKSTRKSIKRYLKKTYGINYSNFIFDYDYERYGIYYDDKLTLTNVWEVIETYAQLYFIYIVECSLITSNYSIRIDTLKDDIGNFPLWNNDFFKRDSRLIDAYSRHSHILDFDAFRLGKKVIEDNKYADFLEFGVFNMTEIGKERGNALELQEIKKKSDEANQKNDHFNSTLKLIRHAATVDNYPFIKIITDEQRCASWGADARELCDIVNIDECSEFNLTLPCFNFRDLVISWVLSKFENSYYNHRYRRGDNTLKMFIYKQIISKLYSYRLGVYNTFGYYKLDVSVEKGTQDGATKSKKYYLSTKKIYAKRFSTDCYNDIFTEKALRSSVGLADVPEYQGVKATLEELMLQNSYFFNDLLKIKNNETDKKE